MRKDIKGIDISNHNGYIDFDRVKNDGVEFIYIKATEGTTYQDPLLNQHYQGALNKGFKLGFYHYLVKTSSPETQAENFYNQIKDKQNDLKPCLDLEETGFDVMDYALRFIARFNQLSNLELCIYAGPYFTNDNLDSRLSHMSFWVAHYEVITPMCNLVWGDGYSGHQYTDTGVINGIEGDVDLNNFNDDILLDGQPISVPEYVEPPVQESFIAIASNFIGSAFKVKLIQLLLNCFGWNLSADGDCGEKTATAIGEFQERYGLLKDYKFGTQSMTKAYELIRDTICGKRFATPLETSLIQHILGINISGVFWNYEDGVVREFQSNNELSQDGEVGPNSWRRLLGL